MNEAITQIVSQLPSMKLSRSLRVQTEGVLITAAGFEERALASARMVKRGAGQHVLVLRYKPKNKQNKIDEVVSSFVEKGFSILPDNIVEFDRYDPEIFPSQLQNRLSQLNPRSVIVDISAMSKLAMLLCLDVCWKMDLSTSVFYAEAKEKGPKIQEYDKAKAENNLHRPSIQVYTGIHGVVRVTRLSSVAMQGQPTAALAFMSFNESLTQVLLNAVYPSRLFLINGKSPAWSWREEATAWIHELLRSEWPSADNPLVNSNHNALPSRATSTIQYGETVCTLLDLYWKLAVDHRILLAPTGSKMQTLGCFFVKALHPDIHIEYPTPEGFLDTYSENIGNTWLIGCGHLKQTVNSLRKQERQSLLKVRRLGD
ncbi:MAG TPA: hypothetical protein VJU84_16210 [Pyrinomonadaceae bacterium]|nr:hypothetical protein [Pyrinomonadaceae bacterium]